MTNGYMGTDEVTLKCPICGERWNSVLRGELGAWYSEPESSGVCPNWDAAHNWAEAFFIWGANRYLWLSRITARWPRISRFYHRAFESWYSHCDPVQVEYDERLVTDTWKGYLWAEELASRRLEGEE